MKKSLFTSLLIILSVGVFAQSGISGQKLVTFKFVPGEDMFYIPWEGNNEQLGALHRLVDEYRTEIEAGRMPVYVDGYSASMRDAARNRNLAFVRANRVKSELITHKGLVEDNFITKNHTTAYTDADGTIYKDMVVVTLRIPAELSPKPLPEPKPEPKPEPQPEPAPKPEPMPETVVDIIPKPATPAKPYCFAVRTNLLYDAFLLPTLGVEWRVSRSFGIKLDGSRSWWGSEKGRVQKMWIASPEVRWYMTPKRRFYLGAGGNIGEANIYKGMLGSLISKDTGYQGAFWNAGLTVGYQLYLSRSLSLDLNLGLGYSRFEYDTFRVIDRMRVAQGRNLTKKLWGPSQAGINLVWTIGNNR